MPFALRAANFQSGIFTGFLTAADCSPSNANISGWMTTIGRLCSRYHGIELKGNLISLLLSPESIKSSVLEGDLVSEIEQYKVATLQHGQTSTKLQSHDGLVRFHEVVHSQHEPIERLLRNIQDERNVASALHPEAPLQHVEPKECLEVLILGASLLPTPDRTGARLPPQLRIRGPPPALRGVQTHEAPAAREREAGAAHGGGEAGAQRVAAGGVRRGALGAVHALERRERRVQRQRVVLEGARVRQGARPRRVVHRHHLARAPERAERQAPAHVLPERREARLDRLPGWVAAVRGVCECRLQSPGCEPRCHHLVENEDGSGLVFMSVGTRQLSFGNRAAGGAKRG